MTENNGMGGLYPLFTVMENDSPLLTRAEVGRLLRVRPRSVAAIRGLKPIKFNSRLIRYRRGDVERWLENLEGGNR